MMTYSLCDKCGSMVENGNFASHECAKPVEPVQIEFEVKVGNSCPKCGREWCEALDGPYKPTALCMHCVRKK